MCEFHESTCNSLGDSLQVFSIDPVYKLHGTGLIELISLATNRCFSHVIRHHINSYNMTLLSRFVTPLIVTFCQIATTSFIIFTDACKESD